MTGSTAADSESRDLVAAFCARHGIESITLSPMEGVTSRHSVCNLDFEFLAGETHQQYEANFKLQGDDARIGDLVAKVEHTGETTLVEGSDASTSLLPTLQAFFRRIERRLSKVHQEQSVQSITFLGNTFVLNGATTFTVVDDDEGRLTIEIHKGNERQQANLLASGLLDGLYEGSIKLVRQDAQAL